MQRGEVWWAALRKPAGRRPVVLLSRDAAYRVRTRVTVATVTGTIRDIPTEVPLGQQDGLRRKCVANLDEIVTIPRRCLTEQITTLPRERMAEVDEAIRFALGLGSR